MNLRAAFSALAPWSGLFAGAFAWFAHHQAASNAVYYDCRTGGPWLTAGLGLALAALAAAGGAVSWRARRPAEAEPERPETRRFAAALGSMAAAVFVFAILLQGLSGLLIPGCLR